MTKPDFGALVISLDLELQWGVRDQRVSAALQNRLLGNREAVIGLLNIFDQFEVAATWAAVGFLFAESKTELKACSPQLKPAYANKSLDPYTEPIGPDEANDPLHYAPSLITEIAAHPRQEIGTHTFSHYYCLEPGQTKAQFEADLLSAIQIARRYGVRIRSIVFSRNQMNPEYIDVLERNGIIAYRGTELSWMHRALPRAATQAATRRGARFVDAYLNLSGPNLVSWGEMTRSNELCDISSSRYLRPYSPLMWWADSVRLRRICEPLELAAAEKKVFHLWWHPHDFGLYTEENLAFLRKVLERFARCRKEYGMRSLTMAEVAGIALDKANETPYASMKA